VPNQVIHQRLRLPSNSRQAGHQRGGRLIEPVLSPILTDQELSPLHRAGNPDFLTDQSESENEDQVIIKANFNLLHQKWSNIEIACLSHN